MMQYAPYTVRIDQKGIPICAGDYVYQAHHDFCIQVCQDGSLHIDTFSPIPPPGYANNVYFDEAVLSHEVRLYPCAARQYKRAIETLAHFTPAQNIARVNAGVVAYHCKESDKAIALFREVLVSLHEENMFVSRMSTFVLKCVFLLACAQCQAGNTVARTRALHGLLPYFNEEISITEAIETLLSETL